MKWWSAGALWRGASGKERNAARGLFRGPPRRLLVATPAPDHFQGRWSLELPSRLARETLDFERSDPEFAKLLCRQAPKRAKDRPISTVGAPATKSLRHDTLHFVLADPTFFGPNPPVEGWEVTYCPLPTVFVRAGKLLRGSGKWFRRDAPQETMQGFGRKPCEHRYLEAAGDSVSQLTEC